MKKHSKSKLVLRPEHIAVLDRQEMSQVQGGTYGGGGRVTQDRPSCPLRTCVIAV